jgi:ectoine hydroxylase-related dioxygenase (phytanoyl-CoA dioxygenase family)
MADALWADLGRRYGIERQSPETWTKERPAQFLAIARSGAFRAMGSDRLTALGDAMLGKGAWTRPRYWGQPLVTFPSGAWDVPHAVWHLDYPGAGSIAAPPAIRVFTFLEPVRPRGGGTPYVAGSHRVVADLVAKSGPGEVMRSADVRQVLGLAEPWFVALFKPGGGDRVRRFMTDEGRARGLPVRVEEMTGDPGDLVVMHPFVLHTVAANTLDTPRMMLVQSLNRAPARQDAQ